ncbi:MAG TPA: hypothetical protein VHX61_14085 [Rhizomicrobium sp.]|jgi:hypothetical protein|nr:hypothetical protein [Rhizomicrobium sp.]
MTARVAAAQAGLVATGRREAAGRPLPGQKRRRTLKQHFCDGLAAAVRAEPYPFATTKPRTMMGQMVRELVLDAARAKCGAIKLVFVYLDEAERTEMDTDGEGDDSQGISEPETRWDWSEEGVWDASRREEADVEREKRAARAEAASEAEEANLRENPPSDAETEALKEAMIQRFLGVAEADRENEARKARLAAGKNARGGVPEVPISGNSEAPATPQPERTIRVGGRLVEG